MGMSRSRLPGLNHATAGLIIALLLLSLVVTPLPTIPVFAQESADTIVQTAIVDESHGYINLSQRGGRPTGPGVDGDGPPPLQTASMTATFSNFELNGISFADWQSCRATLTVDQCLTTLIGDRDGDGVIGLRDLHPGAIGGDTFTFDIVITNTSASGGPVLTTFAFQSKFSESPALGSRIGDKLFSAERVDITTVAEDPLIGVKKNGTANGLFGGKIKGICINSSDDYPSDLNLGVENETLECAGGRTFDRDTNQPVLQAANGDYITPTNIKLPKGLLPGESMTIRLELDAGTDDGALQRAYAASCDALTGDAQVACKSATGPLIGTLLNSGEFRDPANASECLALNIQSGDNVLDVVDYGDVKIIRDAFGNCAPSFDPFSSNQFLTIPRLNWAFTDILDTRDDYLASELPTVLTGATGKFSFLDFGQLRPGEMNFFEILRGFGEFGATLDPSCLAGGSRQGSCGGAAYVPWAEFYGIASGKLVRQEVAGSYGQADYSSGPKLTATVNTGSQNRCTGPNLTVKCKTTDPFEPPGQPNPGPTIGASAMATFSDVDVISDDKTTIANEGGQAGGDRVQFTVSITNTSPSGSGIYLTSFNFQTKRRGLTDINALDGTSIQGRQDLRLGADGTLRVCNPNDPVDAACYDPALGIGRFPNVIGNSLLSSVAISGLEQGKLQAIKKNGTFEPLMKSDSHSANFVCIKSGPPEPDQDADETCSGIPTDSAGNPLGLAPGESQSVRIEMDYGDFRGLILRVAPGTLVDYESPQDDPFGLLALLGDFDCRDQRRLPYCHPDLVGQDWFTSPTSLTDAEFVTVHQPGDAATVMDFEENFGKILAMAGFIPTAEFYQGSTQVVTRGSYLNLPGVDDDTLVVSITDPAEGSLVSGIVRIAATPVGTVTVDEVEFYVNGASIGLDADGTDGWSIDWNTSTTGPDGSYQLTAVARGGGLQATSAVRTVTVSNALTVRIIQPLANSTVTGIVDLVAETTGLNAATGVNFSYQESASASPVLIGSAIETSTGTWELAWDTSAVAVGDYLLTATATNSTETATHTISIEIVTLSVKIIAPDSGAIVSGTVELQAEVVSAGLVETVEFFFRPNGSATATSIGLATQTGAGLWTLNWDTRTVSDTVLTKPATQDELSVVVNSMGSSATDAIDLRISNMLIVRIFLPDNQENLLGYQDLEVLVRGEHEVTSVRFDLYDISNIDPAILVPFGEASESGAPIEDRKFGRPLGNPDWPTGSPLYAIGSAVPEGSLRWAFRNWDTRTIPDGTYGLVATAFDTAGRRATYMVETYIVNDLRIDITAPADGATVSRHVAIEALTSGLFPVTGVVFSVGGSDIAATETTPGSGRWRATWDAQALADGPYTIVATATNSAAETATASVNVTLNKGQGAPLNAFFEFDWSNCILMQCSFLDGSAGGPTSWLWNFGDGNTSTQQLPTHTYATYGVYTVTLTVSNGSGSDSYSRTIPVGNIDVVGFNTNPVNDAGTETITWTSAFKDFGYVVGSTIAVPAMWKTTSGSGEFASLPTAVLFTPEEANGTPPELVGVADDGVLFTITFTDVQFKGGTDVFKGKVNLRLQVDVDLDENGSVDWVAQLGTNVDVTNTDLVAVSDTMFVWVTDPDTGAQVSGTTQVAATPISSVPVSQVEFFVDDVSIGFGTQSGGRWLIDWNTAAFANGDRQLTAVARGGSLVATATPVMVTVNNSGSPPPTVTLTADPLLVASGSSSTLNWSSTDTTTCEASGGWSGAKGTSGSESTGSLTATTTYTLTCSGPGGSAVESVTVNVAAQPTVSLTANPLTVNSGNSSTLNWSSTDATTCEASGGWSGAKGTSGSESTGSLTATTTYTLTCSGPGGSAMASVTVNVTTLTFSGSAIQTRNTWSAIVTVSGGPPNTLISGTWSTGGTPNSCTTNASGFCTITLAGIPNRIASVTWTHTATGRTVVIARL